MAFFKSSWISGDICEASGKYSSDTCGHHIERQFTANDIFTRCPECHHPLRWSRFAESRLQTDRPLNFARGAGLFSFLRPAK